MNKAILLGRVGRDASVKTFDSGNSIIDFSIATNEKWTDGNGEKMEKTVWHNCKKWVKSAALAQYIKKGNMLLVEGSIELEEWGEGEGKKSRPIIKVREVKLIGDGGRQESGGGQSRQTGGGGYGDDDIPF